MSNKEIIEALVTADVQLELVINRFEALGLQLEPNKENPNAISTLIYETQSKLGELIFSLSEHSLTDDVVREGYYSSINDISSAEDVADFVVSALDVLKDGGKVK